MYIKSSLAGAEFSNLYGFSCFPQLYSDLNTTNNNLSNIRVNFKKRDATTVQLEAYTEGNVDGINIQATKDKKFYMSGKFDGTWNSSVGLATKDDLTKSIDFRGNAKMFKVRSGTDGLKNQEILAPWRSCLMVKIQLS